MQPAYKRVLLKLSGEAFLGSKAYGIDSAACHRIAVAIKEITQLGVQVGLVVGGGNIFRGGSDAGQAMDPVSADHIGMLATIINGIALRQAMESISTSCALFSAVECTSIAEGYCWKKALGALSSGSVALFVGGTGNPSFTTDSAAALRAFEIKAEILLKATKVNGVFDKDPSKHPGAKQFDRISYADVLLGKLRVMDATAIALCREHRIPIRIFNMFDDHSLKAAICNQPVGTLVEGV